jgi:iron(III) transport system substrate-binding protein
MPLPRPTRSASLTRYLIALAAAMLLLAGCGGTAETATGNVASAGTAATGGPALSLDDGMAKLYGEAKANGEDEVILAIPTGSDFYDKVAAAFMARYPDIKLTLKKTDFNQMGVIIQTELDAGQRTADLLINAYLQTKPLIDAESIETGIDWPSLGMEPARLDGDKAVYVQDSLCATVIYNKQYVKPEELPADLSGFNDPKWKGKMTSTPGPGIPCLAYHALLFGLPKTEAMVSGLVANGLVFSDAADASMLSGERPVYVFVSGGTAAQYKARNADVGEKFYPGTGIVRTRAFLLKESPSPHATKLVTLFLTSPDFAKVRDAQFLGGSGFMGDTDGLLAKRLTDLELDLDDKAFFIQETAQNYPDRAKYATELRKKFIG